jgi:hypothetical protein
MCEAVLDTGASVRFHARGLSMQPNINDGETVELRPAAASEVSKGEIVLAQTGDGLRLHRVVERNNSGVVTRGDAGIESDAPTIAIVGKAVSLEKADGRESLQGSAVSLLHSMRSLLRRLKLAAARRMSKVRGSSFLFLIVFILAGAMMFAQPASAQADLAVTSDTAAPNPVSPGGQITYTIAVVNNEHAGQHHFCFSRQDGRKWNLELCESRGRWHWHNHLHAHDEHEQWQYNNVHIRGVGKYQYAGEYSHREFGEYFFIDRRPHTGKRHLYRQRDCECRRSWIDAICKPDSSATGRRDYLHFDLDQQRRKRRGGRCRLSTDSSQHDVSISRGESSGGMDL